ncbi:MAG: flavodoxin family protein, partial [Planctomycetota bacterium]
MAAGKQAIQEVSRENPGDSNMAIVGVSGSPTEGGNTDRLVQALLEQSGREHSFVNLSTLNFLPCRGCAHLCARSNICPVEDDLRPFLEPILEADALVLASPINAGTITAWMYSFLSRIWCFHHLKNLLEGKPLVLVVTALFRRSERDGVRRFDEAIRRWGHNMRHLGAIFHATDIPPCFKCGVGTRCKVGGLWGMVGRDEEKLHSFKIT